MISLQVWLYQWTLKIAIQKALPKFLVRLWIPLALVKTEVLVWSHWRKYTDQWKAFLFWPFEMLLVRDQANLGKISDTKSLKVFCFISKVMVSKQFPYLHIEKFSKLTAFFLQIWISYLSCLKICMSDMNHSKGMKSQALALKLSSPTL